MRHFFIFLITLYQKYISPYKGFRCAYACYHESLSCSARVKNIIAEHGLFAGWPLIKQQFKDCHLAYQTLETEREKREREKRQRRRQGKQRECLSKKNQDRCDCLSNFGDCIPDLPCDANSCNYYTFKKSIHQAHKNSNKYDIRE
jgi:putative component of membrane protein insertase Oxa1/YidC/SpoIIIJ protein YidD